MTKWERLRKRLKDECRLEVGFEFQRVYPGYWQRAAGSWSWCITLNGSWIVGSQWCMTYLLKCKTISVHRERATGDYHIFPE